MSYGDSHASQGKRVRLEPKALEYESGQLRVARDAGLSAPQQAKDMLTGLGVEGAEECEISIVRDTSESTTVKARPDHEGMTPVSRTLSEYQSTRAQVQQLEGVVKLLLGKISTTEDILSSGVKSLQPRIMRDTARRRYVENREKSNKTDEEKLKMRSAHWDRTYLEYMQKGVFQSTSADELVFLSMTRKSAAISDGNTAAHLLINPTPMELLFSIEASEAILHGHELSGFKAAVLRLFGHPQETYTQLYTRLESEKLSIQKQAGQEAYNAAAHTL